VRIAKFLGWREFVVAFFIMAFAATLPNLFVGLNSAFHKIPQLSFGEIVGGNVIDLTLAVALAVLISKTSLLTQSRLIQNSALFTALIAILPLLLILDGILSRGDGLILIFTFFIYIFWLFSKEERFKKIYEEKITKEISKEKNFPKEGILIRFKTFLKDFGWLILSLFFLLIATQGIIKSALFFAQSLNLSLTIIGLLIVSLGNSLPEIYFTIISAKRGENWLILGDLMGSVIVPATLVLGVVALICPIKILDFPAFAIGRFFLIISAMFFLLFIKTGKKVTKKEALILLLIYITFLLVEILTR
jgi:cation:H+ antiporter